MDACKYLRESRIGNLISGNADTLVDPLEMRRGIQPGAKARVAQDLLEERRRRSLPVRSRNVHTRVRPVWPPQALQQDGYVFEIEFCRGRLRRRRQLAAQGK